MTVRPEIGVDWTAATVTQIGYALQGVPRLMGTSRHDSSQFLQM
jgi:hypothetical protein